MKKQNAARLISLVTVLAMMLVLCFAFAAPAAAASHEVGTMEELQTAITNAASGDVIYLTQDITLTDATATITIANKEITITSEGDAIYTIKRAVGGFPMFTLNWGATVTLTNVTIDGNNVDSDGNGGAFGVDKNEAGRVLIIGEGATLKNLNATNGGAAYMRSVIMNGGTIENCTAGSNGGGLYVAAQFTMNGGMITGNTAGSTGGGVYVYVRAETTFAGGSITENEAKTGGGVTLGGTKTTVISGTTISDNTTSSHGGGIYLGGGTLQVTGGEISRNTATDNGGGIYFAGGSGHTLEGGTISSNTGKSGGGIATTVEITVGACTITGNTSTGDDTSYGGGGIYSSAGGTVTLNSGAVLSKNGAVRGGGIHSAGTVTVNEGALIAENTSSKTGAGAQISGTFTMNGGTISANTATTTGGGLQIMGAGVVTLNGGSISNNTATTNGGGVYLSGKLTMTGGKIAENEAKNAAGIYVTSTSSDFTMTGGSIEGNVATAAGGGMYGATSATINIGASAVISGNTATTTGGGIHMNGGWLTMTGGSLKGNTAKTDNGGGLYTKTGGWVLISGGEFSGNKAVDGGGIASASKTLVITGNTVISGNTATDQGGGIFLGGGTAHLFLVGGTVENNTSKSDTAAGIEVSNGPTLVMLGGEITTHDGSYAVLATGASKISLLGGSITDNSTTKTVDGVATVPVTLGKTFTLSAVLDEAVVTALADSVTFSADGLTMTSVSPLEIYGNTAALSGYVAGTSNTFNVTLAEDLVAGSRVEFNDNAETEGYFLTLAESFTPNGETLGAIDLLGADAQYAPKLADGALTWPTDPYFVYQNAGLRDDIAYRLYFVMRDKTDALTVTYKGNAVELGTVSGELATAIGEPTYEGLSYVELAMAPKEMTETVTVTLGEAVKELSLAKYVASLKGTSDELDALVDAMLNYGSAAQVYFEYNEGTLANENYDASKLAAVTEKTMSLVDDKQVFNQVIVDVGSKVSVYVIVNTANVNGYKVTLGGVEQTCDVQYTSEYTAIGLLNISASDLTKEIVVTLDGATLTYSVPVYAYRMQGKATDANLVALVRALDAYATAAAAYAAATAAYAN